MDYPGLKNKAFARVRNQGIREGLRQRYVRIIREHGLTHCDHILRRSDWFFYVYFTHLVGLLTTDRNAVIIDWGGFYGQVTRLLMDQGYTKASNYLFDRPKLYGLVAEEFGLKTIYGHHPNHLSLDDASVDVFISSGVLEHVQEDGRGIESRALNDIMRVLKPGGLFFVWNLPALLSLSELLAAAARKWRHQRRYTGNTAIQALQNAGFEMLWLDKHKITPGSILNRLCTPRNTAAVLRADDAASHLFPLNLFALDFAIIARRPRQRAASEKTPGSENAQD